MPDDLASCLDSSPSYSRSRVGRHQPHRSSAAHPRDPCRPAAARPPRSSLTRSASPERAARRYIGILREAGIPVESTRGRHGGYRLGRGTRLPPVVFTRAEALGLVMAVLDGQPAAADGDDLVGTALGKVIRALPEQRRPASGRDLREHAATRPTGSPTRPDPLITSDARRRGRGPPPRAGHLPGRVRQRVGTPRSTPGRSSSATAAGTSCATPTARTRSAPTGSTGSARSEQTAHAFEPPDDLDPVAALEETPGHRVAVHHPRRLRRAGCRRWRRGSGRRWAGSSRPAADAYSSAATRNPAMYAQEWLANVPIRVPGRRRRRTTRRRRHARHPLDQRGVRRLVSGASRNRYAWLTNTDGERPPSAG